MFLISFVVDPRLRLRPISSQPIVENIREMKEMEKYSDYSTQELCSLYLFTIFGGPQKDKIQRNKNYLICFDYSYFNCIGCILTISSPFRRSLVTVYMDFEDYLERSIVHVSVKFELKD